MKKILSLFLAILLMLTVFPVGAFAESTTVSSGTTGDCTWTLNGTVLTISGNGSTGYYDAGQVQAPWGTDITKVIVEEGVTWLYSYAFHNCQNLTEVSLPSTLKIIGECTFYGCTSLKSINVPENCYGIWDMAFYGCTSLESVSIFNISQISERAFAGCTSLKDVWCESLSTDYWYIGDGNEELLNANWHFGSCMKNTENYTHSFENDVCIYCSKSDMLIDRIELSVTEKNIIENTEGYYSEDYGYWYYYDYGEGLEYTVVLKDGTRIGPLRYYEMVEINGTTWDLSYNSNQHDEPWTAGNTYEVEYYLWCYEGDVVEYVEPKTTVAISIIESPVASIDIQDVEILEYSSNYEDGFYKSFPGLTATVTYKDGSVETVYGSTEINGKMYWIDSNFFEAQRTEPWLSGNTYQLTGEFLGATDTFNVTIKEVAVQSVEIHDMEIMQFTNGRYEDGNFVYKLYPKVTVTFKDGTKKTAYDFYIDNYWFGVDTNEYELQEEETWTIGTYQVTGTIFGISDTFTVTITESPVESIVINDMILYDVIDNDDGRYHLSPTLSQVVLKDGTVVDMNGEVYFEYEDGDYWVADNSWDMQYEEPWLPGNTYTVTGTLLGATATFNVTILENPVKEVKLVKMPDSNEFLQGGSLNMKGAVIRVEYNDGTYEDIAIEEDYYSGYTRRYYSEKIDRTSSINVYSYFDHAGEQTTELWLFGNLCEIPVIVKENLMESISIREEADKSITITVYNSDNTSYDMKLLDISYLWHNGENEYEAGLVTDKGEYFGMIFKDGNSFSIGLGDYWNEWNGKCVESNKISGGAWFEAMKTMHFSAICQANSVALTQQFSGEITAENIDDIVAVAFYDDFYFDEFPDFEPVYEDDNYGVYKADDIRKAVMRVFAVSEVDLSLSEYYNPADDTYTIYYDSVVGGFGEIGKFAPGKAIYSNGFWTVELHLTDWYSEYDEYVIVVKLNEDMKIVSFAINPTMPDGWAQEDAGWVYYEGGVKATGWKLINYNWYYFGENGIMQTGWQLINSVWYYFAEGGNMQTGWQYIGYNWYYFTETGAMVTGWHLIGGIWYYFADGGNMVTSTKVHTYDNACDTTCNTCGEVRTVGDHVYDNEFDADCNICGATRAVANNGWVLDGSNWFYYVNGNKATGWQYIGANWYYFNQAGIMQTGWQLINNNWYYFYDGGNMVTGWLLLGNTWYFLAEGGNMVTGWQLIGGTWYYFHAGGNMATGWLLLGSTWYYMAEGGNMVTGWQLLGGNWYLFADSGAWIG